jgi:hypothetical protein
MIGVIVTLVGVVLMVVGLGGYVIMDHREKVKFRRELEDDEYDES